MGSNHGPHHSSSNKLQTANTSADNVSTGGQHGEESSGLGAGLDTKIAKKGSDGKRCLIVKLYVNI